MKLLSRNIVVSKAFDAAYQIIRSSAYYFPAGVFEEENFSFYCPRRSFNGRISLFPMRGTITKQAQQVEITLSLQAGFLFYFDSILSFLGIIGLFWCLIAHSSRWIPFAGCILLGILTSAQYIWEGAELLDRIEHKLLRP